MTREEMFKTIEELLEKGPMYMNCKNYPLIKGSVITLIEESEKNAPNCSFLIRKIRENKKIIKFLKSLKKLTQCGLIITEKGSEAYNLCFSFKKGVLSLKIGREYKELAEQFDIKETDIDGFIKLLKKVNDKGYETLYKKCNKKVSLKCKN